MHNHSIRSRLTIRRTRAPLPPVEILYHGQRYLVSLENIHRMLELGLTPTYADVIALAADAYHCTIPELHQLAVESAVQR